jgi:anti-sigma-K factor RskA
MASCEQLAELYEAYALGALEGAELAAVEEHLARQCPTCAPGVAQARTLVANLSYLAPPAEPPADLRRKLLAAIAAEPAGNVAGAAAAARTVRGVDSVAKGRARAPERAWIPAWAWVAAAALVLFAGYTTFQMRQFSREVAVLERQGAQEQQRSRALDSERERYLQALNIIGAAATRRLQLKPGKTAMPPVSAYWNPGMGLVLAADKMPEMPPGRTLQLWVVPQQGAPISVGIFRPNAAGQVLMVMPPGNAMLMAKALAISDEPAGGSPQPTSTPEWVGPVS